MEKKGSGAAPARRAVIAGAISAAVEHLRVVAGMSGRPTVVVTLAGGERIVARHLEFEGDRVDVLAQAKDGYFDTVTTHVDDVLAVRIVDDGRRRHVEPFNREPAINKLVIEMVATKRCATPTDETDLREILQSKSGLASMEEAANAIKDDHLLTSVVESIDAQKTRLGDLEDTYREAIRQTVATTTARDLLERTWKPFIREDAWMDAAAALCASNG